MPADCSSPKLSIVVASYNARASIGACLESLAAQQTTRPFEVIVVDSSTDGTADLVGERFPAVRLLRSHARLYCGDARNRGIAVIQGDIIAFVDADCTVGEGWVNAVLAAHARPQLAIGGMIDNGSRSGLVAWAHHFCEFSRWLPCPWEETVDEVAGCALSLKRQAFERYGPFIGGTYCSDTAFLWRMARDGHRVLLVPAIRVYHSSTYSLRAFLRHETQHGRSFARVRVRERALTWGRRALLAAALPLLPWLLFARIVGRVARRPAYALRFLAAAPVVLLGLAAWSWGECLGYLGRVGGGIEGAWAS